MASPPHSPPTPLLTVLDVANIFKVTELTVKSRPWRSRHGLRDVKIGRSVRFLASDVAAIIARGTAKNGGPR